MTDLQTALSSLDELAVSNALDIILPFQTVLAGEVGGVLVGDHVIWVDRQDPSNVGWAWRRAFVDGAPTTGEDDTFDSAEELRRLLDRAGYLLSGTSADIEALEIEAGAAGDMDQVILCRAALNGDRAAWHECVKAIEAAR